MAARRSFRHQVAGHKSQLTEESGERSQRSSPLALRSLEIDERGTPAAEEIRPTFPFLGEVKNVLLLRSWLRKRVSVRSTTQPAGGCSRVLCSRGSSVKSCGLCFSGEMQLFPEHLNAASFSMETAQPKGRHEGNSTQSNIRIGPPVTK